jgi:SpoIID/LytB domain protein
MAIEGDKASVEVAGDLHIRRLLGGLKSTLFEVKKQGDSFVFHGAGFGHGVGMCQMGAIGMASAGKSKVQILTHYYRGSHLHKLY